MNKPPLYWVLFLSISSVLAADAPVEPCSLAVGIVPRTGLIYRTWANALETLALQDKGLVVCQDDAPLDFDSALKCKTEFVLKLLYRPDRMTRNITIFKNRQRIFDQDYEGHPSSQKLLRTLPTCAELQKLPVLE